MNSEARALYWEFALRLVSREEVAAWADRVIEVGHPNEELFELSTCAELDDNVIMNSLTALSLGYDRGKVEQELIVKLVAHFPVSK